MHSVCVCILVHGDRRYWRAGRRAVASVLRYSDFPVLVAAGDGASLGRASERLHRAWIALRPEESFRAAPFLLKLRALEICLRETRAERFVLLDADALFAAPIDAAMVDDALAGRGLAMAEQPRILGSELDRAAFLEHYRRYSLTLLAPGRAPPPLADFRYFNSGVVLATRAELARFLPWALATVAELGPRHEVGAHMVADQDYFQVWANTLHPGSCTTLPWRWNHAAAWDEGFPRRDALILHLTNSCRGPSAWRYLRLDLARAAQALGSKLPLRRGGSASASWT